MWLLALATFSVALLGYILAQPSIPQDYYLTIEEKAEKDGYPIHRFNVTTEDGFVLALFRIAGNGRSPVLLLHGFACGVESFVFNFYTKPLAYRLADAGFDVWLGSNRGNLHSRKHIHLTEDQSEFWDWTSSEMAWFDVPAFIHRVLEVTNQPQLSVLGHSQGGTMTLMALYSDPSLREKVSAIALLASPPGRIPGLPASMRIATSKVVQNLMRLWGMNHVLDPPSLISVRLAHYLPCLSRLLVPVTFDARINADDPSFAVISSSKSMGGTSLKNLEYIRQLALPHSSRPHSFDFGPAGNTLIYHSVTPEELDYSVIDVPVGYFAGGRDEFVSQWEITVMKELLGNNSEIHRADLPHDHMGLLLSGNLDYVSDVIEFLAR